MYRVLRTLAMIALVSMSAVATTRGDFVASLAVEVTSVGGGFYSYQYVLTNSQSSTLPVVQFDLAVGADADLQEIVNPVGWGFDYVAGAEAVSFYAEEPDAPIGPGATGIFSFLSRLAPTQMEYYLVGSSPPSFDVLDGTIGAPGVVPVPEPSSALLLGASLAFFATLGARRAAGRRI